MYAPAAHTDHVVDQLRRVDATTDPGLARLILSEAERLQRSSGTDTRAAARLQVAAAMARRRIEGKRPLRR